MNILEVNQLSKDYKGLKAVDKITFSVKKGEILGLLGPNGAGKSTTISMISTLLKPNSGYITFNGENSVDNPKVIQPKLGYVPQEIALYPMLSGMENLIFFGKAYGLKGKILKSKINEIAEMIGIGERLKDRVANYSGGMKRRLNIGVALLHDPELVIMDEPTVGIDPQSRKHILDTVLALNEKGMTVIYTSHYMEEVEYLCNRICIMDKGKIIAEGTKDELVEKYSEYREIVIKLNDCPEMVVQEIGGLEGVIEVIAEEEALHIKIGHNSHVYNTIINLLTTSGCNILSMDLKEVNLETVFLALTGKALRD